MTSTEKIEKLLQEAIDSDPGRELNALWEAIDALAEDTGHTIPAPLVTKTIALRVDARFPADGSFERLLASRVLEVLGNEYMESSPDLMGYDGPLIHQISAQIAD